MEEFKIPKDGKMVKLHFKEGIAMLREAGKEVDDFEDLSTENENYWVNWFVKNTTPTFTFWTNFHLPLDHSTPCQILKIQDTPTLMISL